MSLARWLRPLFVLTLACNGSIGGTDPGADPDASVARDTNSGIDGFDPSSCGIAGEAMAFFTTQCARCHQNGRWPTLSADGLGELAGLHNDEGA